MPKDLTLAELVFLGREDLVSFSRWPLGYTGNYALWACQQKWQELAQDCYLAKLADPQNTRNLCVLAPSEHGKTYGLDIPFILWALARNRNLRIGIIGSKEELAANIGHGIDRMFKAHGAELARFGLIPDYPWNAYAKFLQRDDQKLIHPSLSFLGPESEMQGMRFDIIFLSDLPTFKNSTTVEMRKRLEDWYYTVLHPRLEPNGFIMAEGHHVDPEDLYATVMEPEDSDFRTAKYKAIIEEPEYYNGNTAKLLAPERWTYRKLDMIRGLDVGTFNLIYQNMTVARQSFADRSALDRMLDRSRPLLNHCPDEVRLAYRQIVMSVDPAWTIGQNSAYSACLVYGIREDSGRELLGGWRLKLLPPQLKAKLVQTFLAFMPDVCFMEANAAQVFLLGEVRQMLGVLATRVRPVYTLKESQHSPETCVGLIVRKIEGGFYTLPYQGEPAVQLAEQFMSELLNFPGKVKDVIMSAAILENGMGAFLENLQRFEVRRLGLTESVAALRWGRGRRGIMDQLGLRKS